MLHLKPVIDDMTLLATSASLGPAMSMSTTCSIIAMVIAWCCAGMPEGWDGAALARLLADVDAEACRRARNSRTTLDSGVSGAVL